MRQWAYRAETKIRQWYWQGTHYEKIHQTKMTSYHGGFITESVGVDLKPGDQLCIRTFLPMKVGSTAEMVTFHEKHWYTRLKRMILRTR